MRTVAQIDADLQAARAVVRSLLVERERARGPRRRRRKATRWHGQLLLDLQAAVESGRLYRLIAYEFDTSVGCVANLAYRHGWIRPAMAMALRAAAFPPGASAPNP